MYLPKKDHQALMGLKNKLERKEVTISIVWIATNKVTSVIKPNYLLALQYLMDLNPKDINFAVIEKDDGSTRTINIDELQKWRTNNEAYYVEIIYRFKNPGEWTRHPADIRGKENALCYQPNTYYDKLRIVRLFDGEIIHEEESKNFKYIYSDGSTDKVYNVSMRMAESIGEARCRKNGTDYSKLVIMEAPIYRGPKRKHFIKSK